MGLVDLVSDDEDPNSVLKDADQSIAALNEDERNHELEMEQLVMELSKLLVLYKYKNIYLFSKKCI